jgi:hypothetical protein
MAIEELRALLRPMRDVVLGDQRYRDAPGHADARDRRACKLARNLGSDSLLVQVRVGFTRRFPKKERRTG